MRIVGGALAGRRFSGDAGDRTRPTADRVREAIGSILEARDAISGRRVLDLFAGTGALAFEALSRGAIEATLVERDRRMAKAIEKSARELGLAEKTTIAIADVLDESAMSKRVSGAFELVFADPPYAEIEAAAAVLDRLALRGTIADGGLVVLEHATRSPPGALAHFTPAGAYRYGDTSVVLLTKAAACDSRDEP